MAALAVTVNGRTIPLQGPPLEVIYSWEFQSVSDPEKVHEVILRRNGDVSCPCNGWIFAKKDKITGITLPRGCRHVDNDMDHPTKPGCHDEIEEIRALFNAGKPLPTYEVPTPTPERAKRMRSKVFTKEELAVVTPGRVTLRTRRMISIE